MTPEETEAVRAKLKEARVPERFGPRRPQPARERLFDPNQPEQKPEWVLDFDVFVKQLIFGMAEDADVSRMEFAAMDNKLNEIYRAAQNNGGISQ